MSNTTLKAGKQREEALRLAGMLQKHYAARPDQWVRIDERLPEEYEGSKWFWLFSKEREILKRIEKYNYWKYEWYTGHQITHWIEIVHPSPPIEDTETT